MRKQILSLAAALICTIAPVFAQPSASHPTNPGDDPDNRVPIGGIEILLAAGACFGVRWMIVRNKVSSERPA